MKRRARPAFLPLRDRDTQTRTPFHWSLSRKEACKETFGEGLARSLVDDCAPTLKKELVASERRIWSLQQAAPDFKLPSSICCLALLVGDVSLERSVEHLEARIFIGLFITVAAVATMLITGIIIFWRIAKKR